MAIFYHALNSGLNFSEVNPGDPYLGSDREYLSYLLGGLVGFAYAYKPKSWNGYHNYEILIPNDSLVFLGKNGSDVPRTREENWDEECILVTAKKAVDLCSVPNHRYTEVAFLASEVKFGKPFKCLKTDIGQLLNKQFSSITSAMEAGVNKVLELGLEETLLFSEFTGKVFVGLNLPFNDEWTDLIYNYSLKDYPTVKEWLMNKPNAVVKILKDWKP